MTPDEVLAVAIMLVAVGGAIPLALALWGLVNRVRRLEEWREAHRESHSLAAGVPRPPPPPPEFLRDFDGQFTHGVHQSPEWRDDPSR